jgi:hypothetical protein
VIIDHPLARGGGLGQQGLYQLGAAAAARGPGALVLRHLVPLLLSIGD